MKAMMMKRDRSQVHQELKAKGVEFPMTDLDTMVPIRTPRKSHTAQPRPPPQPRPPQQPQAQPLASEVRALALETTFRDNVPSFSVAFLLKGAQLGLEAEATLHPQQQQQQQQQQQITLNANQLSKLARELGVVEGNMAVLSEMLVMWKKEPSRLH